MRSAGKARGGGGMKAWLGRAGTGGSSPGRARLAGLRPRPSGAHLYCSTSSHRPAWNSCRAGTTLFHQKSASTSHSRAQ